MKVLLVNPNRYTETPVPPLGLEYLAAALEHAGHRCHLLDLTFSPDPGRDMESAVREFSPGLAAVSVRNIDTGIAYNTRFFLDEFAAVFSRLNGLGLATVAGGVGFSFSPAEILAHLGARWGVDGPGEGALPLLIEMIERGAPPPDGTVLDGWETAGELSGSTDIPRRCDGVDYRRYLDAGAVAGFRTQTGCRGACPFCAESGKPVIFREPDAIVRELRGMVELGVTRFHLCDSEFNQDLEYCHRVLDGILAAGLKLEWALYMKTAPFDEALFGKLAATGANLITFTYPSCVPDEPAQARQAISLAQAAGIRVAIDYLCGFPGQSESRVASELDNLRAAGPDTVGVSNCIRLYPGTGATRQVFADPSLRSGLIGQLGGNPGLLRPVFYSGMPLERIRLLTGGDPLFKIEGFERSTNYQRLAN